MQSFRFNLLAIAGLLITSDAPAKTFNVSTKDKRFSQSSLAIKVGDMVNIENEDSFSHNVFSLSDTKTFDLGLYPQGQSKTVTFDQPGTVEVECGIHPDMKLVIQVTK